MGTRTEKKKTNTTTNGSLKSLTVFVKVLFDVLTFQKLLPSVEPVSWETRPAVVGGWMVDLEEKKQEQKGLEIEIKLLFKPRWEGKTVEEAWWDQTAMRLDI